MTTALQLPYLAPEPDCLETVGVLRPSKIHHYPGFFCRASAGPRADCPRRAQRAPAIEHGGWIAEGQAARVLRLAATLRASEPAAASALAEIVRRVRTLYPGCEELD